MMFRLWKQYPTYLHVNMMLYSRFPCILRSTVHHRYVDCLLAVLSVDLRHSTTVVTNLKELVSTTSHLPLET